MLSLILQCKFNEWLHRNETVEHLEQIENTQVLAVVINWRINLASNIFCLTCVWYHKNHAWVEGFIERPRQTNGFLTLKSPRKDCK